MTKSGGKPSRSSLVASQELLEQLQRDLARQESHTGHAKRNSIRPRRSYGSTRSLAHLGGGSLSSPSSQRTSGGTASSTQLAFI